MKLYRCIFVLRKKTLLWNVFERFRRSLDKRRQRRRRQRRTSNVIGGRRQKL